MKTRLLIIICIVVFIAASFMVIVYFEPESIGLTKPYTRVGEYDGSATERALMISEQCLDQEQNPFKDYAFAKTSNGHYYIDNVICERINVEQGGCLEPFSKGYPDETCKNRVTFDYPYGETGPEINKEFCNQVKSEPPILNDTEQNDYLYHEYLNICTIRSLIDNEWQLTEKSERLSQVLRLCENTDAQYLGALSFENSTHHIDSQTCTWRLLDEN